MDNWGSEEELSNAWAGFWWNGEGDNHTLQGGCHFVLKTIFLGTCCRGWGWESAHFGKLLCKYCIPPLHMPFRNPTISKRGCPHPRLAFKALHSWPTHNFPGSHSTTGFTGSYLHAHAPPKPGGAGLAPTPISVSMWSGLLSIIQTVPSSEPNLHLPHFLRLLLTTSADTKVSASKPHEELHSITVTMAMGEGTATS